MIFEVNNLILYFLDLITFFVYLNCSFARTPVIYSEAILLNAWTVNEDNNPIKPKLEKSLFYSFVSRKLPAIGMIESSITAKMAQPNDRKSPVIKSPC